MRAALAAAVVSLLCWGCGTGTDEAAPVTTTTAPENVDGFRAYLYGHSRTMTESGVQDILGQMRSVCQEAPDRFQLFMALQLDEGRAEFSFTKEGVAYLCPHRLAEVDEVERATTGG